MSNQILIKRGLKAPPSEVLLDGELGYSREYQSLYIKDSSCNETKVPSSQREENIDYTGIIPIGLSNGGAGQIELDETVREEDQAPTAAAVRALIGELEELETENKSSLTVAINEIDDEIDGIGVEIQKIWDKINYIDFQILSFRIIDIQSSSSPKTSVSKENGLSVINPKLTWSFSKPPIGLSITNVNETDFPLETEGEIICEKIFEGPATHTLKLIATDDKGKTYNSSVSISFYNCFYVGSAQEPEEYDSNFIKSLSLQEDGKKSSSFIKSFTLKSGPKSEQRYVYYCHPVNNKKYSFTQGGFSFPMNQIAEIDFENDYGYTTKYKILRSSNCGLGETDILVTEAS